MATTFSRLEWRESPEVLPRLQSVSKDSSTHRFLRAGRPAGRSPSLQIFLTFRRRGYGLLKEHSLRDCQLLAAIRRRGRARGSSPGAVFSLLFGQGAARQAAEGLSSPNTPLASHLASEQTRASSVVVCRGRGVASLRASSVRRAEEGLRWESKPSGQCHVAFAHQSMCVIWLVRAIGGGGRLRLCSLASATKTQAQTAACCVSVDTHCKSSE